MPRQPSAEAHEQVLEAATKLFGERGIDRTSMDSIAELSGVSKATIYKHWADKEALLLEVMARLNGLKERPSFDTGDTLRDLTAILGYHPSEARAEQANRISPHLIAYSAHNPKFGQTWRATMMDPPRREIRQVLERGIEKGLFPRSLDFELSLALLLGPMLYDHIFGPGRMKSLNPKGAADKARFAERVAEAFCQAFAQKPTRSGKGGPAK